MHVPLNVTMFWLCYFSIKVSNFTSRQSAEAFPPVSVSDLHPFAPGFWWCTVVYKEVPVMWAFFCSLPLRMDCRKTVNCYSSLKVHLDQRISDRQTYLREMVSPGSGTSKWTTLLLLFEGKTSSTVWLSKLYSACQSVQGFLFCWRFPCYSFNVFVLPFSCFATRTQ